MSANAAGGDGRRAELARSSSIDELVAAIGAFLHLIEQPPQDSQARLRALAAALDRLSTVYHSLEDVEPTTVDTPAGNRDHAAAYRRLGALFPEFGMYSEVEPEAAYRGSLDETTMGDAVDDLADIAGDLSEVADLLDKGETQNAIWQFRFTYQSHWGRHLRSLQRYVHYLIHER